MFGLQPPRHISTLPRPDTTQFCFADKRPTPTLTLATLRCRGLPPRSGVLVDLVKDQGIGHACFPLSDQVTTAGSEKVAQQLAGALFLDAAVNFWPVMRRRLVE
jgi:hypothetical protein